MTCLNRHISGTRAVKRLSIALFLSVTVAGCQMASTPDPKLSARDVEYLAKAPKAEIDRSYHRYLVDDPTGEAPGTIVIDTKKNFLWYVMPGKKAIRYGVATGKEAFGWTGVSYVKAKKEWPTWMPTEELMTRWPEFGVYRSHGPLAGGPDNPLGARALYLFDQGGKDTMYRIHGTNEPEKIGQNVSSGCIRMRNIDVVDLYNRAGMNTKVIVR
jgi:lipoprotein-anchoring transpeptidase ErfK/SrfK